MGAGKMLLDGYIFLGAFPEQGAAHHRARSVSTHEIAGQDLFGLRPDALRRHIDRKGLKHVSMPGRGGNVPNWYVWLNDADPFEEKCEEETEETVEKCEEETETPVLREHDLFVLGRPAPVILPEPEVEDEPVDNEFCISDLQTTFTGEFDPVKFMEMLSKLPIPKKNVTIRVDIEVN